MKNLSFILLLALFTIGCVTPQKSFEDGDYNSAFQQSLRKLKNKKATSQEREIAMESLRQLLSSDQTKMTQLENLQKPKDWKKALKVVDKSRKRIEKIEPHLSYDYSPFKENLNQKENQLYGHLFHYHFDPGMNAFNESIENDDKHAAQVAYNCFKKAEKYLLDGIPIDSLKEDCVKRGKRFYAVNVNSFGLGFGISSRNRKLARSTNFLDVSFNESEKDDCRIDISFSGFHSNTSERCEFSGSFSEDILVRTETSRDTAGNFISTPIYEEVHGRAQVFKKTKNTSGSVSIYVTPITKHCKLRSGSHSGSASAKVSYNVNSGDDRAIPSEYKEETFPDKLPDDDDLEEEILDDLYKWICSYIH